MSAEARLCVAVRGAVQGVGFRPFVYRLASDLNLAGWVRNTCAGLEIEAEGPRRNLVSFLERLPRERPPLARIHGIEYRHLDPAGYRGFEIRESRETGPILAGILPDIATCGECLHELFDPSNRRFRYPFINCTHCGPRYSIIESLPYDRPNTTMRRFRMCDDCRAEYENPRDRRFHAQPNACPACGPRLEVPVEEATDAIRRGRIVAVKGIGGFHLFVDARNDEAVRRLRRLKNREEKPLALMFPSMNDVKASCEVGALEAVSLESPEAPIVLLRKRSSAVTPSVAPGNPYLGVLLPYAPLHHLLLRELGFPVVATSGNRSDEPICTDNREAAVRLGGIADLFLFHDRPIARRVDDSIVRVLAGRMTLLRRARGFAPVSFSMPGSSGPAVAVGGHLKNTVAVSTGSEVVLSPHVGDLETPEAFDSFRSTLSDFRSLYRLDKAEVACDAHPEYRSTHFAEAMTLTPRRVQHHYAHVLSCMAESGLEPPVLGVAWDGTGYGTDGTIWGGEFLRITRDGFDRVAHLRTFRLPGGERAVREPRRAALGVLYELFGENVPTSFDLSPTELRALITLMARGVQAPVTSSAGRLFDAVAALLDIRYRSTFEGQAAMELEFALEGHPTNKSYSGVSTNWEPIVRGILEDRRRGERIGLISAKFHNSLAEMIVTVAKEVGENRIALTGGCFQNRYLTERAVVRLEEAGFRPYLHQRVPPNDGGIALGQILALRR